MPFADQNAFQRFNRSVRRDFRYAHTPEQADFLTAVEESSPRRVVELKKDAVLYRAQLGHDWREVEIAPEEFERVECAYPAERMKPVPDKVGDGRVNAKGILCLYLATKEITAALEVRPLIGSYISMGAFTLNRDVRIVDCSDKLVEMFFRFKEGDWTPEEIEKQVWTDINVAFSEPTERADGALDYVPTQIIAEVLKRQGYDGIGYKSSFGEAGFNVALFDIDDATLRRCGLHRVKDVTITLQMADNDYFIRDDRTPDPVITDDGPSEPE
ncbi:RES family NAD+ phosphorylase [Sphingomonas donggukensis]|uniref:RES family NAD+ phosphorylase n=1 Tax=Sphingomonas donggukensis TaxID=2949093 RepID=A0ABY4TS17_9SPHN|nr:RES family NAD+ phosphorylase [Sphingomonas donggukensis]URW75052.1 RES family NAD+ phosphorylase [Sphingomonas donggukensis]